jgi:hypothetical protein
MVLTKNMELESSGAGPFPRADEFGLLPPALDFLSLVALFFEES